MNFLSHMKRATAALRKSAADKPQATLKEKVLSAIGVEPRPYRIVVDKGDHTEIIECTREQAEEARRNDNAWKR